MIHLYQSEHNKIYEKRIAELTTENIKLLKELQYLVEAVMDARISVTRADEIKNRYFKEVENERT